MESTTDWHSDAKIASPLLSIPDAAYGASMSNVETVQTMVQIEVTFDGRGFLLAQEQDLADLKHRIVAAMGTTGTFVDLVIVGNRKVSVLITPRSHVIITEAAVPFDSRDTGDVDSPFGGYYDLL